MVACFRNLRAVLAGVICASLVGLSIDALSAEQRMVTVNGVWLTPEQIMIADQNAGFRLPNGHYWYDQASGYWGVVGGPVLGRVAPGYAAGGGQSWYHAGPGGYAGSDGSCSYYFDPQTGSSVMTGNC